MTAIQRKILAALKNGEVENLAVLMNAAGANTGKVVRELKWLEIEGYVARAAEGWRLA